MGRDRNSVIKTNLMKLRKFLLVLFFFYTLIFSNSYSIEPDVFVQSTVNRASNILSKNISKEDKINELKYW